MSDLAYVLVVIGMLANLGILLWELRPDGDPTWRWISGITCLVGAAALTLLW